MDQIPDTPGDLNSIKDELLHLLAKQGKRMPFPVFMAALMIGWMARGPAGAADQTLTAWLLVVAIVLTIRMIVLGKLPHLLHLSADRRLQIAACLTAVSGATLAFPLAAFPAPTDFHLSVQTLLLVGLCAGSVASTAGYRPVFLSYLVPVIGTLVVRWALNGNDTSTAVAFIIALFGAVLVALAADSFRLLQASFQIQLRHVELNKQLRAALQQAESANRAKTRFLAAASHDLRQPIHTVSLFAAALGLRPLDPTTREISRHIDAAVQSLTGQLDSLLDISKLDAGVIPVQPGMVSVVPFLQLIHEEFAPVAAAKGLTLSIGAAADAAVMSDEVLLGRILRNLVDNAIKYTDRGWVSLSARVQDTEVALVVEDSGRGIPLEEHSRVFEEFYQLDNPERSRSKGLGLGLSIVSRLVDLLGARLQMASVPGAGTSFCVSLPAYQGAPAAAAAAADLDNPLSGMHVLVVDDESAVRAATQALLSEMGARVTLADGSSAARVALRDEAPDLLLVDFRLRGTDDGVKLVSALRSLCPGLPAILVSGDTSPERLREAAAANIPLLHKPVRVALLKQAVANMLTTPTR